MKRPTAKNMKPQIEGLRLARERTKKVQVQITELACRNWKGSEAELAKHTSAARKALGEALERLDEAQDVLEVIQGICERKEKGK